MSSLVAAPEPAARPAMAGPRAARVARVPTRTGVAVALGFAAAIVLLALGAQGGTNLSGETYADVGVTLAGSALVVAALLRAPVLRRAWGGATVGLFVALAAWTAASIGWSVFPDDSLLESARTLSYVAAFAGGAALARLAPQHWRALLVALVAGTTAVSVYALLSKVFPGAVGGDDFFARLRAPFGYWNAIGLMAALGFPACLWLGARRDGHGAVGALAFPAAGLLLLTVLLSVSRGALLALALGLVLWFACVPLRLRAVVVLVPAAVFAGLVTAWAFARPALSHDGVDTAYRSVAGHQLGMLLIALVVVLGISGLVVRFALAFEPLREPDRRRAGAAVLAGLALVVLVGLAVEQSKPGGLPHQISHTWSKFTNPNATTPGNDPSRLTAAGSVRARYWDEALKVWRTDRLKGVGAGGFATARQAISRDQLLVRHAHGYAVQTLADLGVIGALLSLAVAVGWLVAALRTAPLRRRGPDPGPVTPERIGVLTLLATVVVFAVHSFVDWTWFIPADAVLGLFVAGWLAGRGPLEEPAVAPAPRRPTPFRLAGSLAVVALALVTVWSTVGPLRAQSAGDSAEAALADGHLKAAVADARAAADRDPLSPEPWYDLSSIREAAGQGRAAKAALEHAVRIAPAAPEPWLRLGQYELDTLNRPQEALHALAAALARAPHDPAIGTTFDRARSAVQTRP